VARPRVENMENFADLIRQAGVATAAAAAVVPWKTGGSRPAAGIYVPYYFYYKMPYSVYIQLLLYYSKFGSFEPIRSLIYKLINNINIVLSVDGAGEVTTRGHAAGQIRLRGL